MPSILRQSPFPFHSPAAQQLHRSLSELFPSTKSAMVVAERAGLDTGTIFSEQAPFYLWFDLLAAAARAGMCHELVQQARDLLNAANPKRPLLDAVLAAEPVPIEIEPRDEANGPRFIRRTDEVSEQEALLFHDDLTLSIGRLPRLIGALQRLLELGPTVCRFEVEFAGTPAYGTGFRIGPDLLLSNWHVFHDRGGRRAVQAVAEFGHEEDRQGQPLAARPVRCDMASVQGDDDDDWAVVRTSEPLDASVPILALSAAADPVMNEPAFIIQHPLGFRKRVGFVRNQISFFDDRVVQYLTDTQEGSSGAPVFDGEGRLIALHHAGGRPQELPGRVPLKKNEGIRISRIVAGLAQRGIQAP
ncbi:trypsin-like peptidase domain-containing protein [Nannocystis sp. SCPEA4]|uniref:trypsin-like peptidase domain-containing protein n=1 Tax=Nannocystis sp. SCPEA4 TaxID=2996787 RepID=UPI002270AC68|nr:trypsin-like peptidase domain-containing protein [Nannocystis sp. SCPEA4]MCY1059398.1 trypsin-like peptidase domain-containing protein [Nannocystis sp. SCPEA4]